MQRGNSTSVFLGGATFTAGRGGIARVARMCAQALHGAGYNAAVMSFLDGPAVLPDGSCVTGFRGSKARFFARAHLEALTRTHFLYDSVGVARAHPRLPGLKPPYVVWMHGLEVWEDMRADYGAVVRSASMVLTNTEYTLARHEKCHGPLRRARVCLLATEQDSPPDQRASFAGPPRALIVGRLDRSEGWKGHAELLQCWPQVVAAVPNARLVIAGGGGGLEALRARVASSGAASSIDVLGFVPEADLPALFQDAHVFAMPSRQEGFGISYVEAMRFGLPVIASIHDGGQEVNVDGQTGFNVDLDKGNDLVDRLILLLSDAQRASAMGEAGFQRWRHNFRFSSFSRRFIEHFGEFVSSDSEA